MLQGGHDLVQRQAAVIVKKADQLIHITLAQIAQRFIFADQADYEGSVRKHLNGIHLQLTGQQKCGNCKFQPLGALSFGVGRLLFNTRFLSFAGRGMGLPSSIYNLSGKRQYCGYFFPSEQHMRIRRFW